jgi:hypothetical protein
LYTPRWLEAEAGMTEEEETGEKEEDWVAAAVAPVMVGEAAETGTARVVKEATVAVEDLVEMAAATEDEEEEAAAAEEEEGTGEEEVGMVAMVGLHKWHKHLHQKDTRPKPHCPPVRKQLYWPHKSWLSWLGTKRCAKSQAHCIQGVAQCHKILTCIEPYKVWWMNCTQHLLICRPHQCYY